MEELLKKSEEILTNNIGCYLEPETKEILTLSILGVILVKGKEAIDKFPKVLQTLTVISDKRSVVEIAHQELGNYNEDEKLSLADACMTRTIENKNGKIEEQRTLIISSLGQKASTVISQVTISMHEFFHLLRFGKVEQTQSGFIIHDGVSHAVVDDKLNLKRRKHFYIEEGIVENNTQEGIEQLKVFLQDYNAKGNPTIECCKKALSQNGYEYYGHEMAKELVSSLYRDPEFKDKANNLEGQCSRPSALSKYFDSIVGFGSFNAFSKKFDELVYQYELLAGTSEALSVKPKMESLCSEIKIFLAKSNKIPIIYKTKC